MSVNERFCEKLKIIGFYQNYMKFIDFGAKMSEIIAIWGNLSAICTNIAENLVPFVKSDRNIGKYL